MAAWGYGPTESDGAQDFLADNRLLQLSHARKTLDAWWPDPDATRGAAQLLADLAQEQPEGTLPYLELAIDKLEKLKDNEQWLDSWDEPRKGKRAIQKQIRALQSLASRAT